MIVEVTEGTNPELAVLELQGLQHHLGKCHGSHSGENQCRLHGRGSWSRKEAFFSMGRTWRDKESNFKGGKTGTGVRVGDQERGSEARARGRMSLF